MASLAVSPSRVNRAKATGRVLSPQDFATPAGRGRRRPQTAPGLSSPKRSTLRVPPKVTSTLYSASPFDEPSPTPSPFLNPTTTLPDREALTSSLEYDAYNSSTRTRSLSLDTFGRRSVDEGDSRCPARALASGGELDVDARTSPHSSVEDLHLNPPEGPRRSTLPEVAQKVNASVTPPTSSAKLAAWQALQREADEEWDARFGRLTRNVSTSTATFNAMREGAEGGMEAKLSMSTSRASQPSFTHLMAGGGKLTDLSTLSDGKTTDAGGFPTSPMSVTSDELPRHPSLLLAESRLSQGEPWTFWRPHVEGPSGSIAGSSRGYTESAASSTSRHNSVASSASSSSRQPLSHRKSSNSFLAGLIGSARELGGFSSEYSGPSVPLSPSRADRKQLLKRNSKLVKLLGSDVLAPHRKQSATDILEGRGSPLKSAFPIPSEASDATSGPITPMPRPKRRMSVPSRRGQGGFVIPKGMVFPLQESSVFEPNLNGDGRQAPSNEPFALPNLSVLALRKDQELPSNVVKSLSPFKPPVTLPLHHPSPSGSEEQSLSRPDQSNSRHGRESLPSDGQGVSPTKRPTLVPLRYSAYQMAPNANPMQDLPSTTLPRPRSRSDAEVLQVDDPRSLYNLATSSSLRRVVGPPVIMDPHDEEQHQTSEASIEDGESDVGVGDGDDQHPRQKSINKVSQILGSDVPLDLIVSGTSSVEQLSPSNIPASPSQFREHSHLSESIRSDDASILMNRSGSSRTSRAIAALAAGLLSPGKVVNRLSSSEDISIVASKDAPVAQGIDDLRRPSKSAATARDIQSEGGGPSPKLSYGDASPSSSSRRPSLARCGYSAPLAPQCCSAGAQTGMSPTLFSHHVEGAVDTVHTNSKIAQSSQMVTTSSSLGLIMDPSAHTPSGEGKVEEDMPALETGSSNTSSITFDPVFQMSPSSPNDGSAQDLGQLSSSMPNRATLSPSSASPTAPITMLPVPPQGSLAGQRRRSLSVPLTPPSGALLPIALPGLSSPLNDSSQAVKKNHGSSPSNGANWRPLPSPASSSPSALYLSMAHQGGRGVPSRPPRRIHQAHKQGSGEASVLSSTPNSTSAGSAKGPSSRRARLEKFFGGGMSSGATSTSASIAPAMVSNSSSIVQGNAGGAGSS